MGWPDGAADRQDSKVNEDSILAVQVFDQKKFKKKDQGFLGVINIRIGDVIELTPEADGTGPRRNGDSLVVSAIVVLTPL